MPLAKITIIIDAIKRLMDKWRTKVHLYGESTSFETRLIGYYRGILQLSLSISLILFVLAVNPLSHLLSKEDGSKLTTQDQIRITSLLLFVDDLKLYGSSLEKMRKLLDIVTQLLTMLGCLLVNRNVRTKPLKERKENNLLNHLK